MSTRHLVRPSDPDDALTVGLDVGGTKIAAGIVAFPSGRVVSRRIVPTGASRPGEIVLADSLALAEVLLAEAADLAVQLDARVVGVGLAVAELVDPAGNVTSSQTFAWRDLPVQARLAEHAPAVVESDVRAAALAEAAWGAGQPYRIFAYVTVGTGISSTLVVDGRPFAGARGNALVLATAPLSATCPSCGTTFDTVLEEIASGPALVAHSNRSLSGHTTRAEEVFAAAAAGDTTALDVLRTGGEALGNSVAFLANVLDPEAIVVGGGLGLAGGSYWSSFVDSTRRHIWSETTRALPILPAALGTDAGLIGAAGAIWLRQTSPRD